MIKIRALFLTLVFSFLLIVPVRAFALSQEDLNAINLDTVWHKVYPKVVQGNCDSGSSTLIGNDNAEKIWRFLTGKGLTAEQAAGVMGNLQAESSFDPAAEQTPGAWSDLSGEYNHAVGIAQWDGGRRVTIINTASSQGKDPKDLGYQLDFMFHEATDRGDWDSLKATSTVADATLSWHQNFEVSADGPDRIQGRINFANDIFNQFSSLTGGGSTSTSTSTSAASCAGAGSGVVVGNVVKTALGLAWPEYGHFGHCEAATPAYQAAVQQFSSADTTACTGCDTFVATVMRSSGVDPNYQLNKTNLQLDYVTGHPEKYQIVGTTTSDTVDPLLQPEIF